MGFPSGSAGKNLPAVQEMQEMWVWSLSGEDPLEEGMATHSSILAWRIPWTEEPTRLQSVGLQRVSYDWGNICLMYAHTQACTYTHHTVPHHALLSCLMKVKEERAKVGLKLNIKKIKIMAFGPIASWEIDGETMKTVTDYFWGSKINADGDCSHEIQRCFLLGRKAMTNLDSILKSRDMTLPTKVCLVKAMVFPVVMYGYESWTIKKAEHRRIDAFELWCWRRLLRVPWTARRSNQSILKEISPEYSFEGLMLKLKLQYFGPLMQRTSSLEKTWCWRKLKAGGEGTEDDMVGLHHQLDGYEFE